MPAVGPCARHVAVALVCCLLSLPLPSARGGPVTGSEYNVKAGFIYNFANFVTWPAAAFENSPDTLVLCFFADQTNSDVLYKLDGKTIKGRKIKVMAYQDDDCLQQSHIFFFATQDKVFIARILGQVKDRSVLTIGEVEGFTRMGGVINFFVDNNRLRFQVNVDAADRLGLRMSSQIMGSAQIVHGKDQ